MTQNRNSFQTMPTLSRTQTRGCQPRDWAAVLFALVLPSLVTLTYFIWAEESTAGVQQTIYAVAKIIQFAFPVWWVARVQQRPVGLPGKSTRGVALGIVFGLVVLVAGLGLYHTWLRSADFFVSGQVAMRDKIADLGINHSGKFIAVGVFYSLLHSLLEEYYWRWFVFGQLKRLLRLWPAVVISALGFMAHHVLVIGTYFGFFSPTTWIFSLAVALGGGFWAWLYHRSDSLLGPWLSHLLVDAGIFLIGFEMASK